MLIDILTNNGCPNSRAFNCPLLVSRPHFEQRGHRLQFHWGMPDESALAGEVLFVNSNVFRDCWFEPEESIFPFLSRARTKGMKIVWFDTTDSTWSTQFGALPYVDVFLKSQIFSNRELYLQKQRTGRFFTDFFDELYRCGEDEYEYSLPAKEQLQKIDISWNTCFENYTPSRYGLISKAKQRLRPYVSGVSGEQLRMAFAAVRKDRPLQLSCRVGLGHSRPSVIAHRQAIIKLVESRGVSCGKIPLDEYFGELTQSCVGVGPFGVGEITLRDFEIIICGAALLKPDMSHMLTWPDLFQPDKTFVSHAWDLSDFNDKVDMLLSDSGLRANIAKAAQDVYTRAISDEGMAEFTERLISKACA